MTVPFPLDISLFASINVITLIIYFFIFIVGTWTIYHFGLKPYWNKMRKEKGIIPKDNDIFIDAFDSSSLGMFINLRLCFCLMLFSLIITTVIMVVTSITIKDAEITFSVEIQNVPKMIFMFAAVLDVSIDYEGIVDKNKSKFFGYIYVIIAWFKRKIIEFVIRMEIKAYHKKVDRSIDQWHRTWIKEEKLQFSSEKKKKDLFNIIRPNSLCFGIMIMHIDSTYLDKIIPNDCDEEIKNKFLDLKRDLCNNRIQRVTIISELKDFFKKDILETGITHASVLGIFKDIEHNDTSGRHTYESINEQLSRVAQAQEIVKKPTKKMVELEFMKLFDVCKNEKKSYLYPLMIICHN